MRRAMLILLAIAAPGAAGLGGLLWAWAIGGKQDTADRWIGVKAFAVLGSLLWLAGLSLQFALIHASLVLIWLGLNTLFGPAFALIAAPSSVAALPAPSSLSQGTVNTAIPEEIQGALTLGAARHGDLWEWVKEGCVIYPRAALGLHGLVIGRSGSGKTETLLRIAYLAAKVYGYRVIFLDAKGDWNLAARFLLLMSQAGIPTQRIGLFPNTPHNGWLGDAHDLLNKLIQSQQWSEPFYKEVAVNLLSLALNAPGGLPRNSTEFLERLNPNHLLTLYKGKPQEQELKGLDAEKQWGAYLRYSAFFRAVRGKLDGTASFGSYDASYYLLDAIRLKDEAGRLGQYLIEDFEQFLATRRYKNNSDSEKRTLIIIDDYSAIASAASAVSLFERIRGLRGCVLLSAQTEEGLGFASETRRIMGTAPTIILHASVLPKETIEAGGMVLMPQLTYHFPQMEQATFSSSKEEQAIPSFQQEESRISLAMRRDYRIQPGEVQQLPAGRAYVIHSGLAQLTDIAMLPYNEQDIEKLAADLQREYIASQQSTPASPAPSRPQKKKQSGQHPSPGALPRLDDLTQ
jgi:hypothetical protein